MSQTIVNSDHPSSLERSGGIVCPPRNSILYSMLSNAEANTLDQLSHRNAFPQEACVFHQHSDAKNVYNVVSGTLLLERLSAGGQRQVLAFLFPGDFLGFTHNPYFEFSLHCLTPVQVVAYNRKRFLKVCDEIPQLKRNVEQISSNVLASALDQVFALGQKKAHERVCFFLKQLLKRQAEATLDQLELRMSRRDIGDYLGLTIETVSRAFGKLKADGIIEIHDATVIKILDADALDELASS